MLIISPLLVPYIFIKFFDKINQNLPHCMLTLRLRLLFTFGFVNVSVLLENNEVCLSFQVTRIVT